MSQTDGRPLIRRFRAVDWTPSRREGIREKRLLCPEDSPHQNLVLVEADDGAEVELHPFEKSESFVVLAGLLEIRAEGFAERIGPGDVCHFPPGAVHGLRVVLGPARFLAVFAPARDSTASPPES